MVLAALKSLSEMELPANNVPGWMDGISSGRSEDDVERIERAAYFAIKAHEGQKRSSGEDYVNHTFAVAAIVHELGLDSDVVISALLHDTVEDTDVTVEELRAEFGPDVAQLVDGVTKMEVIQEFADNQPGKSNHNAKAESLRKMMLAMVDDVRVVLIKLCDRLHNMRTLGAVRPEKQKRYIEPEIYKSVANKLSERRVDRQKFIDGFIGDLNQQLVEIGIDADIKGRVKHIYSIWQKMQKKD